MNNSQAGQTGALSINQLQDTAINVVDALCSILCRPVELVLRPWHGTRYFQPPIIFFSTMLMILLPVFSAIATAAVSMIPFAHVAPPMGLYGIGSLAKLYFILTLVHSIRHYRRMLNMSLEKNSVFEGSALPFFYLLPSASFWRIRIVYEPLALLVFANVMGNIFIFQSGLVTYLDIAALALAMHNFLGWYRAWEFIRNILDTKYAAPIIASMSEDRATEEELSTLHMASFPTDLPPDIREAATSHMARVLSGSAH